METKSNLKAPGQLFIKITLYAHGKPITAILDTGSELNVVQKDIAESKLCLPVDITQKMTMNDVNGNSSILTGKIKCVPLSLIHQNNVITEATDVFIGEVLPCELLLGHPWQKGNFVDILERHGGTYLIFKETDTDMPRYQVLIKPEQYVKPFKRNKAHQVYSALTIEESPIEEVEKEVQRDESLVLAKQKALLQIDFSKVHQQDCQQYLTPLERSVRFVTKFETEQTPPLPDSEKDSELDLFFGYGNPPIHPIDPIYFASQINKEYV